MRTKPESPDDPLLEAVLHDEDWLSANAVAKAAALGVLQTRRRRQTFRRWAVLSLVVFLTAVELHRFDQPASHSLAVANVPRVAPVAPVPSTATPASVNYMTDSQLLASFPPGSCFLAEVNGVKKLVFYDPQVQKRFIASSVQ